MLVKTTIVASVLLAGLATAASAQTYEPNGNFQALWTNASAAIAPVAPTQPASRATVQRPVQAKKKSLARQGN